MTRDRGDRDYSNYAPRGDRGKTRSRSRNRSRSKSRSPSPNRNNYRNHSDNRRNHRGSSRDRRSPDKFKRNRRRSGSRSRSRSNEIKERKSFNLQSKTTRQDLGIHAKTEAKIHQPASTMNDSLPQLIDRGGGVEKEEEIVLPMDLDFDDFEELEKKKRLEEEELQRKAMERKQRLEEIKQKYQHSEQVDSRQEPRDSLVADDEEATEEVAPQPSILSKNQTLEIGEDQLAQMREIEGEMDDERDQLERERLAIEQQKESFGKVTFDMFSNSPADAERSGQLPLQARTQMVLPTTAAGKRASREALLDGEKHLQSNWDDGEGYYRATIGERIGDRFQVMGIVGKGVFSTVLKCLDTRAGDGTATVALKMIRNNDTMRRAAEREKSILLAIAEKDPQNKRFCVRLITHLEYRHHIALVFEYQQMNLREALKKFGKDVGINIGAVRIYARQLFIALRYLMELKVVHADIKLDNILCSEDLKQVKLCDFGSAFREDDSDNDPTPYLVSRFYRAPEIILGLQYDRQIDLWSICVSLFELFTGHVMFPGRTNNEMLRLMMAMKGRFPNKMVKTHFRSYEVLQLESHFEPDYRFRSHEVDAVTGKPVMRILDITRPSRDLATILRGSKAGADELRLVNQLTDLLDKGLNLDPAKRLTVVDALKHPFFAKT